MSSGSTSELRKLPSVERLLQTPQAAGLLAEYSHALVADALRQALEAARAAMRAGRPRPSDDELLQRAGQALRQALEPSLRPAINATGVILHTNLGRAPLSEATRAAMAAAGQGYSNLEYDLTAGGRGSRYVHAEALLRRLTGAEAALVVNNNAGAVLLALSALARGREVIISRSQLIEIGGGFRIPEVMAQSGARLVEVGTTNRTRIADFERAITPDTALLMRAHPSNFRIVGFTEEPALADLCALGERRGLPVLDDLGSGALLDTAAYGLAHEPTVSESLAAGAALVTFSGDKLLGGPQAGIILGRRNLVEQLSHFPLTRALRVDKVTLAGVQANLLHYLKGEAEREIPVWRMIARRPDELRQTAEAWAARLQAAGVQAGVQAGESAVGGGSLPGATLPTWHVAIAAPSPDALAARLRAGRPAVVAQIQADLLLLDPRTVQPGEDEALLAALLAAWAGQPASGGEP
jgi:L-seryl-tRNA(Ser) seleniumtransferase